VYAFDLDRQQDLGSFQRLDDPRDRFKAQIGDVGNILPRRQDDLASAVGEQANQAKHPISCLAAAQGDDFGCPLLGLGERGEQ